MAIEQGYPVTLVHPQHQPAKLVQGDEAGQPERFPAVTVNGTKQEAEYRSLGYLRFGEPPPPAVDHHEFPKTLRHPKYEPEVPARVEMRIENGRVLGTYTIPAKPAVMPDVIVLNSDQEARAREQGYAPAGEYNRRALNSVLNGTVDEKVYKPKEYPKWIEVEENGETRAVLIERDPNAPKDLADPKQYPKLVAGVLVTDPNVPQAPDPREYPKWIHRNGIPSDGSRLAKNPAEEAAIRALWEPDEIKPTPDEIKPTPDEIKPTPDEIKPTPAVPLVSSEAATA